MRLLQLASCHWSGAGCTIMLWCSEPYHLVSFNRISDCQEDNFTRGVRLSQTSMWFLQQVLAAVNERRLESLYRSHHNSYTHLILFLILLNLYLQWYLVGIIPPMSKCGFICSIFSRHFCLPALHSCFSSLPEDIQCCLTMGALSEGMVPLCSL